MKKIYCTLIVTVLYVGGYAQEILSSRFVMPVDTVAEVLVELAMQNAPDIRSAENVALSNKYNYSKSKTAWLDNITARGNLNEYTIDKSQNVNGFTQFPRYNFGLLIPVGIFFNSPKQAKADYHTYQAKESEVKSLKNSIRRNVLTLYQNYLLNMKLKNIQAQTVNDFKKVNINNEKKFEKGQITLEEYAAANANYYNAVTKQANIDHDLEVAKYGLEELIGIRLEDALFRIKSGYIKLQNLDIRK